MDLCPVVLQHRQEFSSNNVQWSKLYAWGLHCTVVPPRNKWPLTGAVYQVVSSWPLNVLTSTAALLIDKLWDRLYKNSGMGGRFMDSASSLTGQFERRKEAEIECFCFCVEILNLFGFILVVLIWGFCAFSESRWFMRLLYENDSVRWKTPRIFLSSECEGWSEWIFVDLTKT